MPCLARYRADYIYKAYADLVQASDLEFNMFKSWIYLAALSLVLTVCDSPAEPIVESSLSFDDNLLVGELEDSVDLSNLLDGPEEFQLVPKNRPCDLVSIDPDSDIDYKPNILKPDNSVNYTLKIVDPGDNWCIADLGFQLDIDQ